jgi:hypothetical protein
MGAFHVSFFLCGLGPIYDITALHMHIENSNCSKAHYCGGELESVQERNIKNSEISNRNRIGWFAKGLFRNAFCTEAAAAPELSVESAEPNDCGF